MSSMSPRTDKHRPISSALRDRICVRVSWARARLAACLSYVRGPKSMALACDPVFIGGTGGSGTRVVTALVQHAGYFIGTNLHRSLDSLDMDRFCDNWLRQHLMAPGRTLSQKKQAAMDRDLESALIWHRSGIQSADSRWALKHPRTVLMLPYLQGRYPQMRFVHVIRDGRDMAFSTNTRQSDLYGDVILPDAAVGRPAAENSMRFWAYSNLEAKKFGETALGARYLRVRLENLCDDTESEIGRLFDWLGVDGRNTESAHTIVKRPTSIGRWQTESESLLQRLTTIGAEALDAFGYE